jgi:hypothetical protein
MGTAVQILAQMPGIAKLPLHQISILNNVLEGKPSTFDSILVVPVPKDNTFELVSIPTYIRSEWDNSNPLIAFDAAVEKFIGRIINRHEQTRFIKPEPPFRKYPILLWYFSVDNKLHTLDVYTRSINGKEALEQFTSLYFKDIKKP